MGRCSLACFLATAVHAQQASPAAQAAAPAAIPAAPLAITLTPGTRQHVVLGARQSALLTVHGPGNGLSALDLELGGGLIAVTSPGLPKLALELGKGGHLRYVVQIGADGTAPVRLDSVEQTRAAEVDVIEPELSAAGPDLVLLRQAEQALTTADSARKHVAGAPAPEVALADYARAENLSRQLLRTWLESRPETWPGATALERLVMTQHARYLIYGRSDVSGARTLLAQAANLPSAPGESDDAGLALTLKTLSSAEAMLGHSGAAIESGERALALYRTTGDLYWQGIVLGNLAADYAEAGDYARGSAALQEGLHDAETIEDSAGVVFCLSQLAEIERQRGDFASAFHAFRDALAWGDRIHYAPLIEAEIEKEQGLFYAQMGLWTEAEAALRQSLLHLNGIDSPISLEARDMLARAMLERGSYDEAARAYDEAAAVAGRLKLQREEAQLLLGRAAALAMSPGVAAGGESAQQDVTRAAAIAEELGSPALRLKVEFTRAEIAPTLADALRGYRSAAALAEANGEREEEAAAIAGEAHALDQLDQLDAASEALPLIRRALAMVERSRSDLDVHDLAASYLTGHHLWYEWAIEIAMHQSRREHNGSEDPARVAFTLSEQGRARSMLDSIAERAWGPSPQRSPELAARVTRNQWAIDDQRALLGSRVADLAATAAKLRDLYREQDALAAEEHKMGGSSEGAERTGVDPLRERGARVDPLREQIASLDDVQQSLLGPTDAMVAFALGPTDSYRWVITRQGVQTERLPGRAQLERQIAPLLSLLERRRPAIEPGEDVRAYGARQRQFLARRDRELERAGALLLGGLPAQLHRVYVVADGALLALPWNALRLEYGSAHPYSGDVRAVDAIEKFEILSEPSASVAVSLARRSHEQGDPAGGPVLVVADPAGRARIKAAAWPAMPPLLDARREAAAIRRYARPASLELLRGAAATPPGFLDAARRAFTGNAGILHLATHTILVPRHPELSGIALASPSDGAPGVLWLRDISSMQAPPLVVLSGCQTQGGSRLGGEALQSLSQAFFFAGAHTVVASLWSVEDASTAELMQHFYRNLLEQHMDASAALRAAQLSLLHQGADVSAWAPFVLSGVVDSRGPGAHRPAEPRSAEARPEVQATLKASAP